jgi:Carboxypeptidase regulatory-like domain/TonB dependent receptor-like, beta-barrel
VQSSESRHFQLNRGQFRTALAQSTATLKGSVTDASGAAVAGAKVVVKNQGTGIETTTTTNPAGAYLVPALLPGVYAVTVSAPNFQSVVVKDLKLDVASTVAQDVQLKVGSVSQEVEITAEAPVLDTSTVAMGQVINQKTVQEIPLNGRHFVDLGLLTPGTVTPPANGFLTFPLRGQGSFAINTAGQREDTVNYMINGVNLNDMSQNQITFQPSINTVSEFKVDNSTYSAQYGRNSGAIVNIATRSGTNEFHGEVFEWVRNEKLDAKNFFTVAPATKPPFKRNNFGAAVGGPIIRDRAHFFASYEGLRQRQGLTINSLVLSDAERATALANGDAAVKALVPLIPASNATSANGSAIFVGSASAPVNIDQGTGDIDVEVTPNDRLHGYVAIQEDLRQEPTLQGNTLGGWGDTRASRRQIGTFSYDHIFGANLTNTVRLGYSRLHITFVPNRLLNAADFNINDGINSGIGLPQINIGGGALNFGGPAAFPQGRGDATVVFSDTVNYLRGRHAWAFGTEIRRFYNNNFGNDTSSFTFANVTNFINDVASNFTFRGVTANKILSPAYGFFAEDSFKWKPNLTLQLGLRYDLNSTPSEAQNHFVVFDPTTSSLVQLGSAGFGQEYATNNKNFQPRLGIVWDPFGTGKTVIRSAYAILTDQPVTNSVSPLNANPPFTQPLVSTSAGLSMLNAVTLAGASGLAPNTINSEFKNPYVQSWNLNIEHQLSTTMGLTVAYVGSKGTHLRIARNVNQVFFSGTTAERPFPSVSASSAIAPGRTLGNITTVDSGANSSYNALWVTLNKKTSHGLQFNTSYTFSKSIDNNSLSSQGVIVQNSLDIANSRGLSDFDVRHRFVISGFYELPFKGNRLYEGWQLGLISQAQSGNPLSVVTSVTGFTGVGTLRPDLTGAVSATGNPNQWFSNPTAFVVPCTTPSTPSTCHFGSLGRNAITGPGFVNTDFSVVKNTKITERINAQFRTEFFDLFNTANFGNPNLTVGNPRFGVISSTRFPTGDFGSSRQIQFALKLQF